VRDFHALRALMGQDNPKQTSITASRTAAKTLAFFRELRIRAP